MTSTPTDSSFEFFDPFSPPIDSWLHPPSEVQSPQRELQRWQWTNEEDARLIQLAKKYNKDWNQIAEFFPCKSVGNIKKRFLNKHNPETKRSAWSPAEDKLIIELYAVKGCSWTTIAEHLEGRQPDAIKNRFYGTLRKKLHKDPVDRVAHAFFDEEELRGLSAKEKLQRVEDMSSQLENLERVLQQAKLHISQLKSSFGSKI
mmetsp:Transcript_18428/g.33193  ORF Transcript_18428/g.33193 Transcript_18428/m.33193 type:complete len:202 (+) Transcript_18428:1709-2314(+)